MNNLISNRYKIAQYIAAGATALTVIGFLLNMMGANFGGTITALGSCVGIVSYIFGGFLTALKMCWSIAKKGWYLALFPVDILLVIVTFLLAVLAFMYVPIIPVRKAYKEHETMIEN